jgi:hypothetical protein
MLTVYPIFQYAYLVNDLEESALQWHRLYGAGPFFILEHHKTDKFMYRGTTREADVSYAFGYLGDTMIQFIRQHDDTPSIYRDMYRAGKQGFHHVGCLVNDFAAARRRLSGLGFENACELWADGVNAAYFDTRAVSGGFTEIHGDPDHILATFALWRRAHENREADGPAVATMEQPYPDGRDPDYLDSLGAGLS